MDSVLSEQESGGGAGFNCGVACFEADKPGLGSLLAAADRALVQAQAVGPGLAQVAAIEGPGAVAGSMDWRRRLEDAIAADRFVLYTQAALSLPSRERMHVEVTARLADREGEALPASDFFPMAARHGLSAALDRRIVEQLFGRLRSGLLSGLDIAINVSANSAADTEFVHWLREKLAEDRALASCLVFEMTETGVTRNADAVPGFVAALRALGARFALDHFGVHRDSLSILQRFLPEYVKLAVSHTAAFRDDPAERFYVASIVRIASSLDIRVLAQAVETDGLVPMLLELGFAGYQGYAAGRPAPLAQAPGSA